MSAEADKPLRVVNLRLPNRHRIHWRIILAVIVVACLCIGGYVWIFRIRPQLLLDRAKEVQPIVDAMYAYRAKTGLWPDENATPLPDGWHYTWGGYLAVGQLDYDGGFHQYVAYRFPPEIDGGTSWAASDEGWILYNNGTETHFGKVPPPLPDGKQAHEERVQKMLVEIAARKNHIPPRFEHIKGEICLLIQEDRMDEAKRVCDEALKTFPWETAWLIKSRVTIDQFPTDPVAAYKHLDLAQ